GAAWTIPSGNIPPLSSASSQQPDVPAILASEVARPLRKQPGATGVVHDTLATGIRVLPNGGPEPDTLLGFFALGWVFGKERTATLVIWGRTRQIIEAGAVRLSSDPRTGPTFPARARFK